VNELLSASILVVGLAALGLFLSLSYLAERERALKVLVLLALLAADLLALPVGLVYLLLPVVPGLDALTAESLTASGLDGGAIVPRLPWFGGLSLAVGALGLLILTPFTRRVIARLLPIDPERVVHVTALHYALFLTGLSLTLPVFMPALDEEGLRDLADAASRGGLGLLWAQALGFVVLGALGVGLVVTRDHRAVAERLGLTRRIDVRWWLGGTIAALASSLVVDALWGVVASDSLQEVRRLSEALFQPYLEAGLLGALTIGLSAGIGEEILFRGAAQPRLGLVFTSLLFAVVHTQYTISPALVQVFVVGLILGLARRRVNTTTAIGVHATYNLILALLMVYAPDLAP